MEFYGLDCRYNTMSASMMQREHRSWNVPKPKRLFTDARTYCDPFIKILYRLLCIKSISTLSTFPKIGSAFDDRFLFFYSSPRRTSTDFCFASPSIWLSESNGMRMRGFLAPDSSTACITDVVGTSERLISNTWLMRSLAVYRDHVGLAHQITQITQSDDGRCFARLHASEWRANSHSCGRRRLYSATLRTSVTRRLRGKTSQGFGQDTWWWCRRWCCCCFFFFFTKPVNDG